LVFQIKKGAIRPSFSISAPHVKGIAPDGRFSHSMNYVPECKFVVIYGGRNDEIPGKAMFDDFWLIKVEQLEYQQILIGGSIPASPRCCHCTFVIGSRLIVCGGQGQDFMFCKDLIYVDLDQKRISK
jgi:hypothetical protein